MQEVSLVTLSDECVVEAPFLGKAEVDGRNVTLEDVTVWCQNRMNAKFWKNALEIKPDFFYKMVRWVFVEKLDGQRMLASCLAQRVYVPFVEETYVSVQPSAAFTEAEETHAAQEIFRRKRQEKVEREGGGGGGGWSRSILP